MLCHLSEVDMHPLITVAKKGLRDIYNVYDITGTDYGSGKVPDMRQAWKMLTLLTEVYMGRDNIYNCLV